MTAEQLEGLLGHTGSTDDHLHFGAVEELKALAPSLARRVIAAEKLVEAASKVRSLDEDDSEAIVRLSYYRALRSALTDYREASK